MGSELGQGTPFPSATLSAGPPGLAEPLYWMRLAKPQLLEVVLPTQLFPTSVPNQHGEQLPL